MSPSSPPHQVVIVGAGFGGLAAAVGLAGARVSITVIDQRNHHLFQPLLYQVGTATLATSEIAWPVRHLLRKRPEITTLLGEVSGLDTERRRVLLDDGGEQAYDTLILATGARHAYSGTTNGRSTPRGSRLSKTRPRSDGVFCLRSSTRNAKPIPPCATLC